MIRTTILIILAALTIPGCNSSDGNKITAADKTSLFCADECKAKNNSTNFSCKLTSAEIQKRRATVLESLRKQILDKKEIANGYAFKFIGTDKMLDELTAFIKTERECCDFFTFNLSIGGDKKEIWLELTGAKEVKEFIKTELEL
jgi:hypothetical protein